MTPAFNDESRDRTKARYGIAQWSAWLVILLSVVLTTLLPVIFRERIRMLAERASEAHPGVQMEVAARYVVGWKALGVLKAAAAKKPGLDVTKSLREEAKTGPDQLRVAIVRAEMDGKEAALQQIDALLANHPEEVGDANVLRKIYGGENAPIGTPTWESFQNRHGWFAKLAASFGRPDSEPVRSAMLNAAFRTFVTGIVVLMISLGSAFIGLAILIMGIVLWSQGKIRFAFGAKPLLPSNRRAYIEAFAMYLGGAVALGFAIKYVLRLGGMWGVAALPLAFGVAVVWPRFRGQSWSEWRATVGLHTGTGVIRELFWGAVGYVAGLPIFGVGIIITMILSALFRAHTTHPIVNEISTDPWTIVGLLLMASVWAPISEELMFRGTLFGHLRQRLGWWPSALAVSLIFAIIHPQGLAAVPALASLALVLAGIREWRGSILGCMMAHAINNTVLIIALVFMVS